MVFIILDLGPLRIDILEPLLYALKVYYYGISLFLGEVIILFCSFHSLKVIFPKDSRENIILMAGLELEHTVNIERTSLSKETYTVKHPRKIFPSCGVFRGVDACVVLKN